MENKTYKCEKCPEPKTFEQMAKDKNRPDGVRKTCKKCENDRIKAANKKSRELAKGIGVAYNTKIKNEENKQIIKMLMNMTKMLEVLINRK